jgi:hypothetical protein
VRAQLSNDGLSVTSVVSTINPILVANSNGSPQGLAFDDAPTLSLTTANPTFTESANNPASAHNTPVTLLSSSTITDPDNTELTGATVAITGGFFAGDALSATLSGNITVASNTNGVLTLTGADTLANYQTVLNSIQFTSTSDNPTDFGLDTTRTITWSVTDGLLSNATPVTTTVSVVGVNDAPTNTAPPSLSVNEDTALVFGDSITVSDPDNQSLTVTLSAGNGTVMLGSTTNLTVSGSNGGASVTIAGLIADLNNALATLSYQGNANFHGADTLTVSTTDGGSPTVSTVNITVNSVDDAPTGASNTVSTAQNTPYVFQTADFGFSDPNDGPPFGTAHTCQAGKSGCPQLAGAGTRLFDPDGHRANPPVAVTQSARGGLRQRRDTSGYARERRGRHQ